MNKTLYLQGTNVKKELRKIFREGEKEGLSFDQFKKMISMNLPSEIPPEDKEKQYYDNYIDRVFFLIFKGDQLMKDHEAMIKALVEQGIDITTSNADISTILQLVEKLPKGSITEEAKKAFLHDYAIMQNISAKIMQDRFAALDSYQQKELEDNFENFKGRMQGVFKELQEKRANYDKAWMKNQNKIFSSAFAASRVIGLFAGAAVLSGLFVFFGIPAIAAAPGGLFAGFMMGLMCIGAAAIISYVIPPIDRIVTVAIPIIAAFLPTLLVAEVIGETIFRMKNEKPNSIEEEILSQLTKSSNFITNVSSEFFLDITKISVVKYALLYKTLQNVSAIDKKTLTDILNEKEMDALIEQLSQKIKEDDGISEEVKEDEGIKQNIKVAMNSLINREQNSADKLVDMIEFPLIRETITQFIKSELEVLKGGAEKFANLENELRGMESGKGENPELSEKIKEFHTSVNKVFAMVAEEKDAAADLPLLKGMLAALQQEPQSVSIA